MAAPAQINRNTLIPIGLAVSILFASGGAAWWLKGMLSDVQYSLRDMKTGLDNLTAHIAAIEARAPETWGINEQVIYQYELGRANPTLMIPDARDVRGKVNR